MGVRPRVSCAPTAQSIGILTTVYTFTETSACTWSMPAAASSIQVLVVGGGGGGASGSLGGGGGGGGAGQVAAAQLNPTPGEAVTVSVGSAGTSGVAVTGSSVTFGTSVLSVAGGIAGSACTFYSSAAGCGNTNLGGAGHSGIGIVTSAGGGTGGNGYCYTRVLGVCMTGVVGQGGYTSDVSGTTTTYGQGGNGGSSGATGATRTTYGSGGGGSAMSGAGASGVQGVVVLRVVLAPTATATDTATATNTHTPTRTPSDTATSTHTPNLSFTATVTKTATKTKTPTPTPTASATATATPTLTTIASSRVLHLEAGLASSYAGTGTTWSDISGSANHGTLMNGVGYSALNGGALTFDGVNDYVTVPSGFANFTTGLTIFAVVNMGDADSWERIVDFGNGNTNDNIVFARNGASDTLTFETYAGASTRGVVSASAGVLNATLASYAVTLDGTTAKIYRNGVLLQSTAYPYLPANVTRANNYIGRSNWPSDAYLDTQVAAVIMYTRALSASEIAQTQAIMAGRYGIVTATATATPTATVTPTASLTRTATPTVVSGGLIAQYEAGLTSSYGGSGTTWSDISGNRNHATLINGPAYSGLNGGQFTFDGVDDYVALPAGFANFTTGMTLFAVANFGDVDSWERLFELGNGAPSDNIVFSRSGTSDTLFFELYQGSTSRGSVSSTNGVLNNTIASYAVTLDGTNAKLYR
ncbi:MAG: LamG domain-containing protein, partial [Roseiflexaceae bacterium]